MNDRPLLDFAALLAPIPGDNPAGPTVPFETRRLLEEARKEDNADDLAPDDPARKDLKKADWPGIVRLAEGTLREVSKDLLVAARLTEALVRLQGFAGLRDGLQLLRKLVDECWDRLNPPIEDGDLEPRAAPFFWLDDPDKGSRLPNALRMVPLLRGDGKSLGVLAIRGLRSYMEPVSQEEFEKVLLATPVDFCVKAADAIDKARDELNQLTASLRQKLEPEDAGAGPRTEAPGLTSLQRSLEECRIVAQEILSKKRPISAPEADVPGEQPTAGSAAPRAVRSRAEVYAQLAQAAAVLQELEPHSPIPYLVKRAVELGALPFPQLIKALIRDAAVIGELNRELGIKESAQE